MKSTECHPGIAVAIRSWVADQYRSKSDVSIPDYLFHAAKKLHMRRTTLVEKLRKYGLQRGQEMTGL